MSKEEDPYSNIRFREVLVRAYKADSVMTDEDLGRMIRGEQTYAVTQLALAEALVSLRKMCEQGGGAGGQWQNRKSVRELVLGSRLLSEGFLQGVLARCKRRIWGLVCHKPYGC